MEKKFGSSPRIYGTGLISLDVVVCADANNLCHYSTGGTCGNVLSILSYLGWQAFPIARLNSSAASSRIRSDLLHWGVKLEYSEQTPVTNAPIVIQKNSTDRNGQPTHRFYFRKCPQCGGSLSFYKPVRLSATKILKEEIASGDVFFFDRVSAGALDLARHFKMHEALIIFEPSTPSTKVKRNQFIEALQLADIIKYPGKRARSSMPDLRGYTSAILEIQTLGEQGLRFRTHIECKLKRSWKTLRAFRTRTMGDTCGCGDWTTAGVMSKLHEEGFKNIKQLSEKKIAQAFEYGQALAAWNCGYVGARGGMYCVSKDEFNIAIEQILLGRELKMDSSFGRPVNKHVVNTGFCATCSGFSH